MKTILLAVALSAGLAGAASGELHGSWTATLDDKRPDRMHVSIVRNGWNHFGNTMKIADFAGLASAQISSGTQSQVQFKLTREAGTISFEGTFKRGDGAGQYSFEANPGYINSLRSVGVTFEMPRDREKTEDQALFEMTLIDVSTAYIRTMQAEGYRESFAMYKKMRLFNVTPEYIHQLAEVGYSNLPADKLVKLRIHGVDIDYIRKMNSIQQER